jgi:hypothetical protein
VSGIDSGSSLWPPSVPCMDCLWAFRSPNPLAPPFQKLPNHPAWVQESNYPQDWQAGQGVRPRWLQLVWPRIPESLTRSC